MADGFTYTQLADIMGIIWRDWVSWRELGLVTTVMRRAARGDVHTVTTEDLTAFLLSRPELLPDTISPRKNRESLRLPLAELQERAAGEAWKRKICGRRGSHASGESVTFWAALADRAVACPSCGASLTSYADGPERGRYMATDAPEPEMIDRLTAHDFAVLRHVVGGESSHSVVANAIGRHQTTVFDSMARLRELGLVRGRHAVATDAGRALVEQYGRVTIDDDRAWQPGWTAGQLTVIDDRGCRAVECRCSCGSVGIYSRHNLERAEQCNDCRRKALGERMREVARKHRGAE